MKRVFFFDSYLRSFTDIEVFFRGKHIPLSYAVEDFGEDYQGGVILKLTPEGFDYFRDKVRLRIIFQILIIIYQKPNNRLYIGKKNFNKNEYNFNDFRKKLRSRR